MKLYDDAITDLYGFLQGMSCQSLDVSGAGSDWPDVGERNMILRGEMAYELGGDGCQALSGVALTGNGTLVPRDEVLLYGPDLPEIDGDISYARIAVVRVKEEAMGEGEALYNAIRKIEYVRYHLHPKGYMLRVSTIREREAARVSSRALTEGLDFAKVGKLFLGAYHENPKVEAVKLMFITQRDFPYKALQERLKKIEAITAAIDHIFKNVTMDCGACNLKEICDEVEGMKELHFGAADRA